MKWITREHPKIDRIACPWLIQRFIDKEPMVVYDALYTWCQSLAGERHNWNPPTILQSMGS